MKMVGMLQCQYCNFPTYPCGAPHAILNISTCTFSCQPGWEESTNCTSHQCYNEGTWNGTAGACECIPPYTKESYCEVADCGDNGYFIDDECQCLLPYTGQSCNITEPLITASMDCWHPEKCPERSNWGVSACINDTLCTCAPLIKGGYFEARQLVCPEGGCITRFANTAQECCSGIQQCEQYQNQYGKCFEEHCCNAFSSKSGCQSVSNCEWQGGGCVLNLNYAPYKWYRWLIPCTDSSLCQGQLNYYEIMSLADAWALTQTMAWREISHYDIWDDGLYHSIVLYTPDELSLGCHTSWRLSAALETPFVSSLNWICSQSGSTTFRFELIEDSTVPAGLIGGVYRIWVGTSDWCIMDRIMGDDERYIYNAQLVSSPLVAIDTDLHMQPIDQCGLYYVQDGAMYSIRNKNMSIVRNGDGDVDLGYTSQLIYTPPAYMDTLPTIPAIPMVYQDNCRHLNCRIPQVQGQCSSFACAQAVLESSSLFSECLPCLMAHVNLGVLE